MGGMLSITGEPGRGPVRPGASIGDITAALFTTVAIQGALLEREKSEEGQYIDISMLDCQVAMLTYQAAYHLHSGEVPGRQGSGHESIPTYRSFVAANQTGLVITANTERMWKGLCEVLDRAALTEDQRFVTNDDRFKNREALWPLLEQAFLQREAKEWVPLLLEAGVPVGEVNTVADALNDPQVRHRNMVLELENDQGDQARVAGNPIKFRDVDEPPHHYPPSLGADTRASLCQTLGLSDAEFEIYAKNGIVREQS